MVDVIYLNMFIVDQLVAERKKENAQGEICCGKIS